MFLNEKMKAKVLRDVLHEELMSRDAELEAIRNSLRYRVGGWVLEALPLGPNTILACIKLLKLYFKRISKDSPDITIPKSENTILMSPVVVFGRESPKGVEWEDVWCTLDATLVGERLDREGAAGTLVLRNANVQVLRRLQRSRNLGWYVIWYPEEKESVSMNLKALTDYAKAHADKCIEVG